MSSFQQNNLWNDLKFQFKHGGIHIKLIFFISAIFLAQALLFIPFWALNQKVLLVNFLEWLYFPSNFWEYLKKPWTILTYMFVHDFSPLHVLFNMLTLYWFGRIFIEFQPAKRLLPVFLLAGITGAILNALSYNFLPVFNGKESTLLGASAAVLGVVVAISTLAPQYEFRLPIIGGIRLMYIALLLVLVDVLMISSNDGVSHIGHLGGALFGFIYAKSLQNGTDLAAWLIRFFDWLVLLKSNFKNLFNKAPKVVYRNPNKAKQAQPTANHQAKIDEILDKINRSGYESLSKEEKDYLFKAGR